MRRKSQKWSPDRKAIAWIARKPRDRDRWLHIFDGGNLVLIDENGGESIFSFDEMTVLHHFLKWFRHEKAVKQAEAMVKSRRAGFKAVAGGVEK